MECSERGPDRECVHCICATRDAEIRDLRSEMESAIERAASANEWWTEARRVILEKDAEIERLKARVDLLEGAMRADEARLMEAAQLAGVGYFGCDTPEVMADTIGELRALVEKRGYVMSRARQRIAEWHDLIESESDLDDSAGDAISVRDVVLKEMEDIRAGLLAAIDEVAP